MSESGVGKQIVIPRMGPPPVALVSSGGFQAVPYRHETAPPKSPMSTSRLEARALLPHLGERIARAAAAFGGPDRKATFDEPRDAP